MRDNEVLDSKGITHPPGLVCWSSFTLGPGDQSSSRRCWALLLSAALLGCSGNLGNGANRRLDPGPHRGKKGSILHRGWGLMVAGWPIRCRRLSRFGVELCRNNVTRICSERWRICTYLRPDISFPSPRANLQRRKSIDLAFSPSTDISI